MKNLKFVLLILGTISTFYIYSQEEFFKNNKGLTISGSTDFSNIYGGGLSLHLKNGVIFSGLHDEFHHGSLTNFGVGYIVSNKTNVNGIDGIINLSFGFMSEGYIIASVNMGLNQMFFSNTNSPFYLKTSVSFSTSNYYNNQGLNITPTISYKQSFFANKLIYPVIGISYSLPINQSYDRNEMGSILFHIGLNIRLSQYDTKK